MDCPIHLRGGRKLTEPDPAAQGIAIMKWGVP